MQEGLGHAAPRAACGGHPVAVLHTASDLSCAFGEVGGEARARKVPRADWQRGRQVLAVLQAACGCPQMAGPAGALSLWTALICADAEGLPWQPDLLLLLLHSQSQDRVLITGALPRLLSAGRKPLVSSWP